MRVAVHDMHYTQKAGPRGSGYADQQLLAAATQRAVPVAGRRRRRGRGTKNAAKGTSVVSCLRKPQASAPTAVVAQLSEFSNLLSHRSPSCARGGTLVLLLALPLPPVSDRANHEA